MSFGSYDPQEVTWLLTDLSHVDLEVGTEDREERVRSGRPYYEVLPVEHEPDAAYTALFRQALTEGAHRIAVAVGLVAELLLTQHDGPPVLVSLARAGTPVGILLRRWYAAQHGLAPPHYAVSIVRGAGIDQVALAHVLARHPAGQVRFVDGWTGKGAIARELAAAVADLPGADELSTDELSTERLSTEGLSTELAVLADPGSCTTLFGTREDWLIPSACLNSTVSGLVSRTVLRPDLTGPGMFHGAKAYPELAPVDVSAEFLDTVTAAFPGAAAEVARALPGHLAADRRPMWSGWAVVQQVAAQHGITDLNLVKPGVGETTRVLLRRIPWRVLIRPDRTADLQHVLLLARTRGVEVVEVPDLAYSCIGIVRPTP